MSVLCLIQDIFRLFQFSLELLLCLDECVIVRIVGRMTGFNLFKFRINLVQLNYISANFYCGSTV